MSNPILASLVSVLFTTQIDPFAFAVATLAVGPWRVMLGTVSIRVVLRSMAISAFGFLLAAFLYVPKFLAEALNLAPSWDWGIVTGSEAVKSAIIQWFGNNVFAAIVLGLMAMAFVASFTKTRQDWIFDLIDFMKYLVIAFIGLYLLSFFL
jgi:hypothetical protein